MVASDDPGRDPRDLDESVLWDRLILTGGPARGGTTVLARLLNSHPEIMIAIDNSVYESWGLYYYRSRAGLIEQLRRGEVTPEETRKCLHRHVVRGDQVWGVAPSAEVAAYPLVPEPTRPDSVFYPTQEIRQKARHVVQRLLPRRRREGEHQRLIRHRVPLELFRERHRLCLKSPEIVFVLPELATAFPKARFVLVYRPVAEIAESMYRKGFEWKLASYHKRWQQELDDRGALVAPPGVPELWHELWRTVTDFQRCIIYATSYVRAMVLGLQKLPPRRVFVYNHAELRVAPSATIHSLGKFLDVDTDGFQKGLGAIKRDVPRIARDLESEYDEIKGQIDVRDWMMRIASFDAKLR